MLLSTNDLKRWLARGDKVPQTSRVLRFLREHKIPHFVEGGEPVTTEEAVNQRLLGQEKAEHFDFREPE